MPEHGEGKNQRNVTWRKCHMMPGSMNPVCRKHNSGSGTLTALNTPSLNQSIINKADCTGGTVFQRCLPCQQALLIGLVAVYSKRGPVMPDPNVVQRMIQVTLTSARQI